MKRVVWLMMFWMLLSIALSAQHTTKFKELPEHLKENISRRDFRQAKKAYEEALADSMDFVIPPMERIIYEEQPVKANRSAGILSISSWGKDVLLPANLRDRVVDECGIYDVVICTVDSGVDPNHSEYKGDWWLSPSNYSGDENKHWHGTHVSGIIWQLTGEVAIKRGNIKYKDVQLLRSNGSGSFSAARNMATTETNIFKIPVKNGVGVIMNNSWGYAGNPITSFDEIIEKSLDQGLIWIGSAGNSGKETNGYPGDSEFFTSVASLDKNIKRSAFSTMNEEVDVAAPGSSINSTLPGDKQGVASGTSMASPFIAGLSGLAYGKYGPVLQGRHMYTYLRYICDDIDPDGHDIETGYGIPYIINMLETDPCDVPGICDGGTPPDDPDPEPGDPVQDPPPPSQVRSNVTYNHTDGHFMRWRYNDDEFWNLIYVEDVKLTALVAKPSGEAFDATEAFLDDYFLNRGIVLPDNYDFTRAVEYTGVFIELISKNEKIPIDVDYVTGRDEKGRYTTMPVKSNATANVMYRLTVNDNREMVMLEEITSTDIPSGVRLVTLER